MTEVWLSMSTHLVSCSSLSLLDRSNQEKHNVLRFEVINISRRSMVSNSLPTSTPIIFSRITDAAEMNDKTMNLKQKYEILYKSIKQYRPTYVMNRKDHWHCNDGDCELLDLRKFRHGFCPTCQCS